MLSYNNISNYSSTVSPDWNQQASNWTWEYVLLAVYIGTCSLVGTLGNIPVLCVYMRKKDHIPTNTFIKVLAMADLAVCSLVMPYTLFYELHLVQSDVLCRIVEYIRHVSIFASNATLVAIAIERYIAVCKLSHKLTLQDVNTGVVVIIVVSCVLAVPAVFIFAVVYSDDVKDVKCAFAHISGSPQFCHFTYTILGKTGAVIYQGVLVVVFCACELTNVVLYTILYSQMYRRTNRRERRNNIATQERPSVSVNVEIDKQPALAKSNMSASFSFLQPTYNRSECEDDDNRSTSPHAHTVDDAPAVVQSHRRIYTRSKRRLRHQRTGKMLFLCTVIFIVTWIPCFLDIFGITNNLVLRYLFFLGNASNPIVYGIVNENLRLSFKKLLLCRAT
jgi:hypothetical protein